jgi:hypothetical protein
MLKQSGRSASLLGVFFLNMRVHLKHNEKDGFLKVSKPNSRALRSVKLQRKTKHNERSAGTCE